MTWFQKLVDQCFKIYLTFSLILFVILILLTNLPLLLAAEPPRSAGIASNSVLPVLAATARADAMEEASAPAALKNPLSVKVSKPKLGDMAGEGRYVEYRGTKLSFVIRF